MLLLGGQGVWPQKIRCSEIESESVFETIHNYITLKLAMHAYYYRYQAPLKGSN